MKKNYRKLTAFLLALAMAATLFIGYGDRAEAGVLQGAAVVQAAEDGTSAASEAAAEDAAALAEAGQQKYAGIPWNDSNILGNLDEESPRLQDDFYQAINYEYLKEHQDGMGISSAMLQAEPNYNTVMKGLINDPSYKSDLMDQIR
ncbi:MAG: hypothetical protein HUJ73_01945, partial [Eubacterium sp.]|nr:hypothetical protein [Eubacterium sp.]